MKLATTIGEVYSFTQTPADAVRFYADTGFKYLDFSFYHFANKVHPFMSDDWREYILDAKRAADEMGFTFVQAHAPACRILDGDEDFELEAYRRTVEACGMLGVKYVVTHTAFSERFRYPDELCGYCEANRPFYAALIPLLEKHDVHILFENTTLKHLGRGFFPVTAAEMNAMAGCMRHPNFGTILDVGHANMDNADLYGMIVEHKDTLRALHIHGNNGEKDQHLAPFSSGVDMDAILTGLRDIGYKGYFTFESDSFFPYRNPRGREGQRLCTTPPSVKKAALKLLYEIGKASLEAYGMFEE